MIPELPSPSLGPNLTVTLNAISTVLLLVGYRAIRRKDRVRHKRAMLAALVSSTAFLIVYVIHHAIHGTTLYPLHDWTHTLYLIILLPHVLMAMLMVPFILRGVWLAWHAQFERHARLMRVVWPVWFYVSVTGVVVYLMLYVLPHYRV